MTPVTCRNLLATALLLGIGLTGCSSSTNPAGSPSPVVSDASDSAAGGSSDPATSETPQPSSTSPSASSPVPPPPAATTTALDPGDPSTWTITFDGVGPLLVGGDFSASVDASVTENAANLDSAICRSFSTDGIDSVTISSGDGVMTSGALVGLGETSVGSPATEEGVGVGATEQEVVAAYPEAVLTDDGINRSYAITNDQGRYIHFLLGEENTVRYVYIVGNAVLNPEFCS